jgi:hypothetical protein
MKPSRKAAWASTIELLPVFLCLLSTLLGSMLTWICTSFSLVILSMLKQTPRIQRQLIDQKIRASPRDLSVFLYKGCIYDPEDRESGLCLGELLITVSLSVWTNDLAQTLFDMQIFRRLYGTYEQALDPINTPVKLQGRLLEYELDTVTPAMVAYSAVQVCLSTRMRTHLKLL